MKTPMRDAAIESVLRRLYGMHQRQTPSLLFHFLPRMVLHRIKGTRYLEFDDRFFRDKLVALDRDKNEFNYAMCRALRARRVVEVGTSFGVSTLYLAAAVRENVAAYGGGGVVIGTELEPSKVAAARANFQQAGVSQYVDLREGDALTTLEDVGGEVDFVLVDTWIAVAKPALERLVPRLRPGAVVVCDQVVAAAKDYADYLGYVRNPANGFVSVTVPYSGGLEVSVRSG
ncbi:O-methyltransferase [Pendulispora albinea]|uniref:Class I SAM-dependent methyltransferase n=1 Tax=Pendulispora albinea TaxID=2741071 RepID=A0ABZ2M075_9BACT